MTKYNLTELEKADLREALNEGNIYDCICNPEEKALCWGFVNKREKDGRWFRLFRKGLVKIVEDRYDTYVFLLISREEAEKLRERDSTTER